MFIPSMTKVAILGVFVEKSRPGHEQLYIREDNRQWEVLLITFTLGIRPTTREMKNVAFSWRDMRVNLNKKRGLTRV